MVSFLLSAPVNSRADYVSRQGFVTLQFDDSHLLHYTHIYPLLEAYGFKGSFGYITEASEMGTEGDFLLMRDMYLAGHEVQDHTTRHNYMWATHVDTVDDDVTEWIEYTFADLATWDSLCEHSLYLIESRRMQAIGWNEPGGCGENPNTIPGHPGWSWKGDVNDSLYDLISTKYQYMIGCGVAPHTAHLNLRGHNCPDRFPLFNVPHVTIDGRGADEVKAGIADAVASGLWYLAVSHAWTSEQVSLVDTVVEWLAASDIEVLRCCEGWQRIAYGQPDPTENQFPQAMMTEDKDGNNKPDGFMGSCEWDTLTSTPVAGAGCMGVFDETEFYCYGPEVGRNALSLWLKAASPCGTPVRIVWVKYDFEWGCLGTGFNTFWPDTLWAKVDSTTCSNMLIDVEDEVDRIRVMIRPLECVPVLVAYPELVLTELAGAEPGLDVPHDRLRLVVRPNPARSGQIVRIIPASHLDVYDVLGRKAVVRGSRGGDGLLTIDTSELAPGVYYISGDDRQGRCARLVVIE